MSTRCINDKSPKNKSMLAAAGAIFTMISTASASHAATVIQDGATVDGWKVTFPAGIALTQETGAPNTTLTINKTATFDSLEGLTITFTQADPSATPFIAINSEAITNDSGYTWSAFQFLLVSTAGGPGAQFDSPANTFTNIAPFTTTTFGTSSISLSGGILPTSTTANWGGAGGGQLLLDTNPTTSGLPANFAFKEVPDGVTSVPLPEAGWSSLSVLGGLAFISGLRRLVRSA